MRPRRLDINEASRVSTFERRDNRRERQPFKLDQCKPILKVSDDGCRIEASARQRRNSNQWCRLQKSAEDNREGPRGKTSPHGSGARVG